MASEGILHDNTFDAMVSLVDELFVAGAVEELRLFGKDVWRNVKAIPEAPNVTVIIFNRIQAALDCLTMIEEQRSRGIYVSRYNGKTTDYRSDRARAIQSGISDDGDIDHSYIAIIKKELGAVKERAKHLA